MGKAGVCAHDIHDHDGESGSVHDGGEGAPHEIYHDHEDALPEEGAGECYKERAEMGGKLTYIFSLNNSNSLATEVLSIKLLHGTVGVLAILVLQGTKPNISNRTARHGN